MAPDNNNKPKPTKTAKKAAETAVKKNAATAKKAVPKKAAPKKAVSTTAKKTTSTPAPKTEIRIVAPIVQPSKPKAKKEKRTYFFIIPRSLFRRKKK